MLTIHTKGRGECGAPTTLKRRSWEGTMMQPFRKMNWHNPAQLKLCIVADSNFTSDKHVAWTNVGIFPSALITMVQTRNITNIHQQTKKEKEK